MVGPFSFALYFFVPSLEKRVIFDKSSVGEKLFYGIVVTVSLLFLVWVFNWMIDFTYILFDASDVSNAQRFSRWSAGLQLFQFNIYLLMGH